MTDKTYREIFNESWLFELPRDTGFSSNNPYDELLLVINSNIKNGFNVSQNGDIYFLNVDAHDIYCWIGDFEIITSLSKFKKGLAMNLVSKKPGSSIHASDFYQKILDASNSDLLFSGDLLSSQGLGIWKNLLAAGRTLMVYDPTNANTYQKLNTVDDLRNFYGSTNDYEKYRYVLSENNKKQALIYSNFELMRAYKLTFNIID